ncbi:MAG: response regulator [Pseudomonadota bacterium]
MTKRGRPVEILLVEDNEGDILLTQEAFEDAKIRNSIHIARDGEEALSMLHKQGPHAFLPDFDLILLDLNLPKIDGKQVLQDIKNDDRLRRVPVVVMTTSSAQRDIVESYNLHANSYVMKPISFESFKEIVSAIEDFWFSVVVLPPGTEDGGE